VIGDELQQKEDGKLSVHFAAVAEDQVTVLAWVESSHIAIAGAAPTAKTIETALPALLDQVVQMAAVCMVNIDLSIFDASKIGELAQRMT